MPFLLLLVLMITATLRSTAEAVAPQFEDGEVVVLVGDSITHGRKWHRYVYEYYLTRFPDRRIRFVNQSIAGDSAGGALSRLDWDILPWKPTAACILLGINDIGRGHYGRPNPDRQTLDARRRALDAYRDNMGLIAERLMAAGCGKLVFVTPAPYDETAQLESENFPGCNAALARCAEYLRELAAKHHAGVVDLHGPMTALNLERQKTDPKFSLIGADRVHPGDAGMLVIAYHFLKDQGMPALVSRIALADGRVAEAVHAGVSGLKSTPTGLEFDCFEKSLPWPVDPSAQEALGLLPLVADLNQEQFAANVPDGKYRLRIDGREVGRYSADALRAGINLAANENAPQYGQAFQVCKVNQDRSNLEVKLRTHAQIRSILIRRNADEDDSASVEAAFAGFMAGVSEAQRPYFTSQFQVYRETRPQLDAIKHQIEGLQQEIWRLNRPTTHHWQLVRVER